MCFICKDKDITGNNTYRNGGIERCVMNCAIEHLIERSKYHESDKRRRLYDAPCRFNILCIDNRLMLDKATHLRKPTALIL